MSDLLSNLLVYFHNTRRLLFNVMQLQSVKEIKRSKCKCYENRWKNIERPVFVFTH